MFGTAPNDRRRDGNGRRSVFRPLRRPFGDGRNWRVCGVGDDVGHGQVATELVPDPAFGSRVLVRARGFTDC